MTRLVPLCLPLLLLAGACDLRELILETEVAPGTREGITRACCECLAEASTSLAEDEEGCAEDAGVPGATPCLCGGLEASFCGDLLIAGGLIDVVGACVQEGGACAAPCDGVLAFP